MVAEGGGPLDRGLRDRSAALLVLFIGAALSVLLWGLHRRAENGLVRAEFTKDAQELVSHLESALKASLDSVHYLRALHDSSDQVTWEEFTVFTHEVLNRNQAIHALEWVPWVPDRLRDSHEEAARRAGLRRYSINEIGPDGSMHPAGAREEYFPVRFVAPLAGNEAALGFDLASNPVRRRALELARRTGRTVATDPIHLVQDKCSHLASLIMVPVFESAAADAQDPASSLSGFYLGVLRIADLVAHAQDLSSSKEVLISVYDQHASDGEQLLFRSPGEQDVHPPALLGLTTKPQTTFTLKVANRSWRLEGRPTATYLASRQTWWPIITLCGSLGTTLILGCYLFQQRRLKKRLWHSAYHDPLTGLPNRKMFLEKMEAAHQRMRSGDGKPYAIIFIDLDRFKLINDSLGHAAGDELLVAVAGRLRGCIRPQDGLARIGGDEFTVLLQNPGDTVTARYVADRIEKRVRAPFRLQAGEVFVTLSMGIAPAQPDGGTARDLLRDSDIALHKAKLSGRDRRILFDTGMHQEVVRLQELESDLRHAVERGEMRIYYQPIVCLESRDVVSFEALVRWEHPQRGLIPPDAFISVAEDTGVIGEVGEWVLRNACRQVRAWQQNGNAGPRSNGKPLGLSVNISGRQILQPSLLMGILDILDELELPPETLTLEITESVFMEETDGTHHTLERLRGHGVALCLDDFGTGFSSLSYLHRLPLDQLKVDRSFVARMAEAPREREIIRSILTLAHQLDIGSIAEGIETEEQLSQIREMRCDFGQGFLFSPPLRPDEVETFLAAPPAWKAPT